MVEETNIIFAFDLDGTICHYGDDVKRNVARTLNKLGHIHIVTGAPYKTAEEQTSLLLDKTIHSMREFRGNKSIDLAEIFETTKKGFAGCVRNQAVRKRLCLELRRVFHQEIYIGGRSTIDVMPVKNKGHIIKKLQMHGKKVIYFYDCKWSFNDVINNDVPAMNEAWKSIRTSHKTVITDVRKCLTTLS